MKQHAGRRKHGYSNVSELLSHDTILTIRFQYGEASKHHNFQVTRYSARLSVQFYSTLTIFRRCRNK